MAAKYWQSISSTDPSVGANWAGGALASGDDAYIQAIPGLTLAPIAAHDMHLVVLNSLTYNQNSGVIIGDSTTPGGVWQIGTASFIVPVPTINSNGAGRVKLDFGASAAVVNIASTGDQPSLDVGLEPMRIIGSGIVSVSVTGGLVGIATSAPSETATVGDVSVSNAFSPAQINMGPGVTWTNASVASGNAGGAFLTAQTGGTLLTTSSGATANMAGAGTITTVIAGGVTQLNQRTGAADVTNLTVYPGGLADFSGNPVLATVTNATIYNGAVGVRIDAANPGSLVITNPITIVNGGTLTVNQ